MVNLSLGDNNINYNDKSGSDYLMLSEKSAFRLRKPVCKDTDTDEEIEKKNKKMESRITQKLKAGKPLTTEERNFLKKNNPTLYRYAVIAETKRKCIENQLKNCRSKEEVQKVQEIAMSEVDMKSPVAEYISSAATNAIDEFKKSDAYDKLPAMKKEAQSDDSGKKKNISSGTKDESYSSEDLESSGQIAYNTSFGSYQQAYIRNEALETMNVLS